MARLAQPTTALPPLARLSDHSLADIKVALTLLRHIYFPFLRPKVPRRSIISRPPIIPDSGYASAEDDDPEFEDSSHGLQGLTQSSNEDDEEEAGQPSLSVLRADTFERTFAIKWLTGFVVRSDTWIAQLGSESEEDERTVLVEEAASLLAACAGAEEPCPALTRRFSFACRNIDITASTIEVELNDAPLSSDDHTSVGLQSWASSIVLARMMSKEPEAFLCKKGDRSYVRVLELGAGTGLLAITTAKLLAQEGTGKPATVVATDYHPDVLDNLRDNVHANFPSEPSAVVVQALDWQRPSFVAPLEKDSFDVILAADVIYHPDHAGWIKACVQRLLTRPHGVFWLIIPLRTVGRHESVGDTVETVFPSLYAAEAARRGELYTGLELVVLDVKRIERHEGIGRADEAGYKLFKIGWF